MAVVSIPNPCPLKLNQLEPVEGGFHCGQCSKMVIDFRKKTDLEIVSILESSKDERVCGVYQVHQVQIDYKPTFQMLKFVASLFLAFGLSLFASCGDDANTHRMGDSMRMGDSIACLEASLKAKADSIRVADSISMIMKDSAKEIIPTVDK